MTVVIQCDASKRSNAGHLVSALGKSVDFVANPLEAPFDPLRFYARPDDLAESGLSWRQTLLNYNSKSRNNPLGLLSAFELYQNQVYRRLVDRFGSNDVYILSAGWGLIRADFLTPFYDITFSQVAERYKRRKKSDEYNDFCMVP